MTDVTNTVVAGHDVTLHAVGDLIINTGFTAPNSVSFSSDSDVILTAGFWQAQHITAQATGLFDASGRFANGKLTVPTTFTTTTGLNPKTVSLTALGDITLDTPVTPTNGLRLHSGGSIVNLPENITVSGERNFIDLITGTDLDIAGNLSAIDGEVSLSARGISQNQQFRTDDFALHQTIVTGASITDFSGSGSTYTVTVNTGTGEGTILLDFDADGGAQDVAANMTMTDFTGEVYEIDKLKPSVTSITRLDNSPTNATSVRFLVTFNEIVTGVATANFAFDQVDRSGAAITSLTGSGTTYTVTAAAGIGDFVGKASSGDFEHWQFVSTLVATTGTGSNKTVTITDVSTTPGLGNTNDGITLSLVSGSPNVLRISYEAAPGYPGVYEDVPLTGVTNLMIMGGAGDDTLTLDFSNGALPMSITYNGGIGGHDTLVVKNAGSCGLLNTTYANVTDGTLAFSGGGMTRMLTFLGLEPITINGSPTNLVFNLPSTNDSDVSLSLVGEMLRLAGSTFEDTDFNPTGVTSITINSNAGNDNITIGNLGSYAGKLTVNGGPGNDRINAAGTSVFALLIGDVGNDMLIGGSGNDTLQGGLGNDSLNGGAGFDRRDEMVKGAKIIVTNTGLTANGPGKDTVANIESYELIADNGSNLIDASAFTLGAVTLRGGGGNDTLIGTSFNDLLDGGDGNDSLDGGIALRCELSVSDD